MDVYMCKENLRITRIPLLFIPHNNPTPKQQQQLRKLFSNNNSLTHFLTYLLCLPLRSLPGKCFSSMLRVLLSFLFSGGVAFSRSPQRRPNNTYPHAGIIILQNKSHIELSNQMDECNVQNVGKSIYIYTYICTLISLTQQNTYALVKNQEI